MTHDEKSVEPSVSHRSFILRQQRWTATLDLPGANSGVRLIRQEKTVSVTSLKASIEPADMRLAGKP